MEDKYIILYAFKLKNHEYYFKEYIIVIHFFLEKSHVDGRRSSESNYRIEDNRSSRMTN